MSLNQTLYYMSLVGGIAGLAAWAITALVSALLGAHDQIWLADFVASAILGAFIGGLSVFFTDKWSGTVIEPRWIASGSLLGLAAGVVAGFVQIPVETHMGASAPSLTRIISWVLTGSCIGLASGLRWAAVNRLRVLHAFTGGFAGGLLGGAVFAGLGSQIPDLSQALGFVFVGLGICFGITLAPILLRDGMLQFVSSGDPRAQSKFGRRQKQWEIQQGDSYVVGSRSQDPMKSAFRPAVQVFIPDAAITARHAILFGRDGRFFVARHPDITNDQALARYVLKVRGKTVMKSQELNDKDDILIGRTALRFQVSSKGAVKA